MDFWLIGTAGGTVSNGGRPNILVTWVTTSASTTSFSVDQVMDKLLAGIAS